jgi:hypothetical protein
LTHKEMLQESFELAGSYISHLSEIRELVERAIRETKSLSEAVKFLIAKEETADVTFSTDIRILINKLRDLESRKPSP